MTCNVRDYGAVGDGTTLDTAAIQAALDACGETGGEVTIPAGTYLAGTLYVRSRTVLNLTPGATLLASKHYEDYESEPGPPRRGNHNLIRILNAHDVIVTGGGRIEGQGPAHWDTPDEPSDGIIPWRGYHLAKGSLELRPRPLIVVRDCRDVRIEDISLLDAPGSNLAIGGSQRVWVTRVNILASMIGPNTDGIDINSCRDVFISGCHIENGDDAIALFTKPHIGPTERIHIDNCTLSSRTCAIKILIRAGGTFRQITANGITVHNSERAVGLYMRGGATAEDLAFSDFVVATGCTPPNFLEKPLHLDVRSLAEDELAGNSRLVQLGPNHLTGLSFSNMLIRSPGRILLAAEEQDVVRGIQLSDITLQITGPQDLEAFRDPKPSRTQNNWTLPHVRVAPAHVVLHGLDDVDLHHVQVLNCSKAPVQGMHGMWLEHVTGEQVDAFRTYPLQSGFIRVYRRRTTTA